jgi:hypothetical protein
MYLKKQSITFEVKGDPDSVGAGADPHAVQDGLPRLHGRLRRPAKAEQ